MTPKKANPEVMDYRFLIFIFSIKWSMTPQTQVPDATSRNSRTCEFMNSVSFSSETSINGTGSPKIVKLSVGYAERQYDNLR